MLKKRPKLLALVVLVVMTLGAGSIGTVPERLVDALTASPGGGATGAPA